MSTLWLVATPIGNLGDLPPRAVQVLADSALVCCEDTRRTGLLLQRAGIKANRLAVCNEHTEHNRIDDVLATLDGGGDVAVVSDAGTPGISDPGERLVRAVTATEHTVSSVPGPSAAVMAVTISGLPTDRFVFEGFIPRKGRDRERRLADIAAEPRTIVMYEAPHRARRTLADLRTVCGDDRPITVARELTKLHETVVRGVLGDIDIGEPRGEYVFVLGGRAPDVAATDDASIVAALSEALASGASARDSVATVAASTGRAKREVYNLALTLKGQQGGSPS